MFTHIVYRDWTYTKLPTCYRWGVSENGKFAGIPSHFGQQILTLSSAQNANADPP